MGSSVVVYEAGPRWRRDLPLMAQEHAAGHMDFIRTILRDGVAVTAGPFMPVYRLLDGDIVGIIVMGVDAREATDVMTRDPAVAANLLTVRVFPFYPTDA